MSIEFLCVQLNQTVFSLETSLVSLVFFNIPCTFPMLRITHSFAFQIPFVLFLYLVLLFLFPP